MTRQPHHRRHQLTCLLFAAFLVLVTCTCFYYIEYGSTVTKQRFCSAVFDDTSTSRNAPYAPNNTAPRARHIDARSLIAATARGQQVSARIIHQSWKTHDVLPHVVALADSWRLAYPDWEYVLWDDADNKELVRTLYPNLLSAYEALPSEIYRADFVRNLYMHAFGGIYADLDSEAITSLEPLLSASAQRATASAAVPVAFVGEMVTSDNPAHAVPNAFFAATMPGHPFWHVPIEFAVAWVANWTEKKSADEKPVDPEFVTGPVALRYSLFLYASPDVLPISVTSSPNTEIHFTQLTNHAPLPSLSLLPSPITPNATAPPVSLLPPEIIYPYTWDAPRPGIANAPTKCVCWMALRTYDRERCKARVGAKWVVNYWGHGW
ncbi:glycosyltransferase family 32 protein [Ceratobasidium sp. AG-Ba]|nr:glycosyltransferase family 32 protein [Ceratobasidium sp. AG-Ba]QRW14333.1 glycosyltransferase family 32 protein [Ceratobasidium sp. AG-Ba]